MSRPLEVCIDSGAAKHNLKEIKKAVGASKVMAVVKSDAYGHGLQQMASALQDSDAFAVASIGEAMALREFSANTPIILLEGIFDASEVAEVERNSFELVVHNWDQVGYLEHSLKMKIPIWLKINTGMNRLGFDIHELAQAYRAVRKFSNSLRLMTHFANAHSRNNLSVCEQAEKFFKATEHHKEEKTLSNSGAIFSHPNLHAEWVRPGIALYGVSPFSKGIGSDLNLRPVMSMTSKLIAVRRIQAGSKVGYGEDYTSSKDQLIGVVAIGYGDGYPRQAMSKATVKIKGCESKVISVSMDMTIIDLDNVTSPRVGDKVLFWGEGFPIENQANMIGTIPYELLCGMRRGSRFQEIVV